MTTAAEGLCLPLQQNLTYTPNNSYPTLALPLSGGNSTSCNFAEKEPMKQLFGYGCVAALASMTLEALLKTRKVHFSGPDIKLAKFQESDRYVPIQPSRQATGAKAEYMRSLQEPSMANFCIHGHYAQP